MSAPEPGENATDWLIRQLRPHLSSAYLASLIRTWTPVAIGALLTYANAHWHITLSHEASTTLILVTAAVTTAVYYALARWAERRWPKVGKWMIALGMTDKAPVYTPPSLTAQLHGATGMPRADKTL